MRFVLWHAEMSSREHHKRLKQRNSITDANSVHCDCSQKVWKIGGGSTWIHCICNHCRKTWPHNAMQGILEKAQYFFRKSSTYEIKCCPSWTFSTRNKERTQDITEKQRKNEIYLKCDQCDWECDCSATKQQRKWKWLWNLLGGCDRRVSNPNPKKHYT